MAISVTDKIKEIMAARDLKIGSTQDSVLELLVELRRQILVELIDAPGDSFTSYRLKQSLAGIEQHLADFESATKSIVGKGLNATWDAGANLLPDIVLLVGQQTNFYHLSTSTLEALREFTFGKISGVTGDLYNKVRGELTLGVLGQKTPAEVAAALAGEINLLPAGKQIPKRQDRWGNWHPAFKSVAERAEVITGTEMGRAFSLATQKSMEAAKETLPKLKKVWLHVGHPKQERPTHRLMHGQVRDVDKAFYNNIRYPRDPLAPIKDVIRCGCTHIPYLPEFGKLETFVADFDTKQDKLWPNKKA